MNAATNAATSELPSPAGAARPSTTRLDKTDLAIIAMLGFCVLMAVTLELYWLIFRSELVARANSSFIANLFRIYGDADSTYFAMETPLSYAFESINVYFTQALNLWLIYAIVKQRPYRHALQLGVASYLTYSVVLYFWTEHVSGYSHMRAHTPWLYFLYFSPNMPWLLFHAFMIWHSARAISNRFARSAS
jgi:hypothetical protein